MNLVNILRRKLAEAPPASCRHEFLFIEEDCPWSVHLTAERRDEWSTVVWELAVRRGAAFDGSLADWADRVASRVSGLMESFKVIEIDPTRNEGLLRSAEPERRDGQLFYYELILGGTANALVRRYQAAFDASQKRIQVPFALTNETLAKLVGDLASEK